MSDTLFIRADAALQIGTGHVMRCLALAQAWKRIGSVIFALAQCPPSLETRLRAEGLEIRKLSPSASLAQDAQITSSLALECQAAWVVVDGYHFEETYQEAIKGAGLRLLYFDDYGHANAYCADLVLNQNLSAEASRYVRKEPSTRLLLGTRYALLRQEFLAWRDWQREIPTVGRKVLVTLGGSDPDNITGKVVESLDGLDLEVRVVVGGASPHREILQSSIRSKDPALSLLTDVSNMSELMAWADLAIAAGGSSSWELAFMGAPSIITVLAENQASIASALESKGISISVGQGHAFSPDQLRSEVRALLSDPGRRQTMSQRGRAWVDGWGVQRVITRMQALRLALRRACAADCQTIWEEANDPQVRAVSFCPDPIPWEVHQRWYAAKLADPNCFFYIASWVNASLVGQIRFELNGLEATISVSLLGAARGKGYGAPVILRGVEQFLSESPANTIHAYIKPDNPFSIRAFARAGFEDAGTTISHGHLARHFIIERENL